jgi:putative endonuclease
MWFQLKNWWERRGKSDQAQAGAEGERLAADFLRKEKGCRIVARNWRSPRDRRDEIDLVCRDGEVLVFVEVKTRAAGALVSGFYAVNRAKKKIMLRACTAYLRRLGSAAQNLTYRFDVVEVSRATAKAEPPVVRHYENIQLFPKDFRL